MKLSNLSKYRTALMGFAALWILYFHMGPLFFPFGNDFRFEISWFLKYVGFAGVDMFVFLSGMGIVYSLNKKGQNLPKFYLTRFLRVYPAFALVLCFTLYLRQIPAGEWWGYLTFYNNFTDSMFASWWYVPAILLFYFFAPLFYGACRKMPNRTVKMIFLLICIGISVIGTPLYLRAGREDLQVLIQRIPVFLIGIGVGDYLHDSEKKEQSIGFRILFSILVAVLFLVTAVLEYHMNHSDRLTLYNGYPLAVMAPTLCIILGNFFALCSRLVRRIFPHRNILAPLEYIGVCSFEFYLCQEELVSGSIDRLAPFSFLPPFSQAWANFLLKLFVCAACAGLIRSMLKPFFRKTKPDNH